MKKKKTTKKRVVKKEAQKPFKVNLNYRKPRYTKYAKQAARLHYWMMLVLITICNFLVFSVLVPYVFILSVTSLLIILGLVGFIFGLIFNFLINDIEHLSKHHHRLAAILIPLVAIVNIYVLISIGRFLRSSYPYKFSDFLYVSMVYVVMFILPNLFSLFKHKKK